MVLFQRFIIPVMSILYIWNLQKQVKQILCDLVVYLADLMQLCFWNTQPSDIIIRMAAFTTYQHCHNFSCNRNGHQILFHVILPSMYSNHSEIQKWHVPKNSHTDILPLEVSYLYWYDNTLYIWYFCELCTTWLISNFYF